MATTTLTAGGVPSIVARCKTLRDARARQDSWSSMIISDKMRA